LQALSYDVQEPVLRSYAMPVSAFIFIVSNRYGPELPSKKALELVLAAFVSQLAIVLARLSKDVYLQVACCLGLAVLFSLALLKLLPRRKYRIDYWVFRWFFLFLQSLLRQMDSLGDESFLQDASIPTWFLKAASRSLAASSQKYLGQRVLEYALSAASLDGIEALILNEMALLPLAMRKLGLPVDGYALLTKYIPSSLRAAKEVIASAIMPTAPEASVATPGAPGG
jgi:hypothetical protein